MMAISNIHRRLPVTTTFLPDNFSCDYIEELPERVKANAGLQKEYPFLLELVEVEMLRDQLYQNPPTLPKEIDTWQIRPGVELIEVSWSGIPELMEGNTVNPKKQQSLIMLIPQRSGDLPEVVTPDSYSLLALKIVTKNIHLIDLAREVGVSVAHLQNILTLAVSKRIILKPESKIVRPTNFCAESSEYHNFLSSNVFTLQWHITQTCDLHCRHCYDRTAREEVTRNEGEEILNQLYEFCKQYNVRGQVSFTGGNPLLHPHFFELYRAASDRGFMTAILGNPTSRSNLECLLEIQMPEFFQVSLEGLSQHNDYIRGDGHYDRVINFLALLKDLDIYSMVMLTLTRANQDQIVPLAENLRNKVDLFTFNRLAMVGEGAALVSADLENYSNFLESYRKAAENNPVMRLKDNFFNIIHLKQGIDLTGGCTGHGCGAAFNFVSLLPDGQVHACRKFPSLLGNLKQHSFNTIYENDVAKSYRLGSIACHSCKIRPVCGGCLAVTHGFGKNSLIETDPYCFIDKQS